MKKITFLLLIFYSLGFSQTTYPPQAGEPGTTAIHKEATVFVAWATGIDVERGFMDISNPNLGLAYAGTPSNALGFPTGNIVSLGDKGTAVLTFAKPIYDGPGYDFAVFENGFTGFLELALVEVSSDGINFFGFPTHSLTQTNTQVGPFGSVEAYNLNNIAGKYVNDYGTPFDLSEIENNPLLDKQNITHVKIIDVVGSIDPLYGTLDSFGNYINDPFPTPFSSSGFDLQAVGVINQMDSASTKNYIKPNIEIYPNPTSDFINIKTEEELIKVEVFNLQGQRVLYYSNVNKMDVSVLQYGIYILKIQTSTSINELKFIKQ